MGVGWGLKGKEGRGGGVPGGGICLFCIAGGCDRMWRALGRLRFLKGEALGIR